MRRLALLLTALLGLFSARAARADPPGHGQRIVSHRIEIRFEPAEHRFVASDVITTDRSSGDSLFFDPPEGIEFTSGGGGAAGSMAPPGSPGSSAYLVTIPAGSNEVRVTYRGKIFDAVQKKDDLSWVIGDSTKGIISEQGIYLTGNSGWYPVSEFGGPSLARFDVTSYVPEPFLVVTQGSVPERSRIVFPKGWTSDKDVAPPADGGGASGEPGVAYAKSVVHAVLPTDDLSLSAGPYKTMTKTVEGIELTTYFLEGEAADAPIWMDAADETVRRYEKILGTYPHPKFDVVENFFSTGYGMPSYTLLGDEVIRYVTMGAKRAGGKIPPGYLDHEYVHGWYGNGLFVDPKDGNWCEALTTYFSNYLAKELESPAAGLEHRRGVLEKYAIRVSGDKDYPVRSFRTKTEDADNDVGYGKGSMIFHMLRKRIGDDRFFAAVKEMSASRVGTFVSWTDWLKALDGEWVRPWLERKGLPAVRLASATSWPGKSVVGVTTEWNLRVEVVEDVPRGEEPYPAMDLPISIDGVVPGFIRLDGKSAVWRGTVSAEPKVVEVDAGCDVLRRVANDDLPPCLNRTLEAAGATVSWSGAPPLEALAKKLAASKHVEAVAFDSQKYDKPVISAWVKRPGEVLSGTGDHPGTFIGTGSGTEILVGDRKFDGPEYSLLVSFVRNGLPHTWLVAMSPESAARAGYATYYGWDQYVVFKNGRPEARGFLDRTPHGTQRAVVLGGDEAVRIDEGIRKLASDEFEGRRPGTPGHDKASLWLQQALVFAGFTPVFDQPAVPFGLGVADLKSSRDLILTSAGGSETIHDAFRPLWFSGEQERGKSVANGSFSEGSVPEGAGADPSALAGLVQHAGPQLPLLVSPTKSQRTAWAPLLDSPNALTPEAVADLAKPGRDGNPRPPRSLATWIAARRSRTLPDAAICPVPVLILEDAAAARLAAEPKVTSVDFEVKFGPERARWAAGRGGANIVMKWMPPGVVGDKPPVIVVSAHYDSHGKVGEVQFRGADDNASGVGCVLEALGALRAETEKAGGAKAGIIVCFFDGEEWGLQGSRALVKPLTEKYDVKACLNVDAVGRVRDDSVYIVGLSTVPDLAAKAVEALKGEGLKVGRDIDDRAYAEGSDHWSFHQAGIPAIDFYASEYAVMDTPADTPDLVDPVGVARLSKALRSLIIRLVRE